MKPIRIQRKRTKGWKMPPNTVYVGRPSKWGNPFKVDITPRKTFSIIKRERTGGVTYAWMGGYPEFKTREEVMKRIVWLFKKWVKEQIYWDLSELKGKNLACWCKEGEPCHADILLKLANE